MGLILLLLSVSAALDADVHDFLFRQQLGPDGRHAEYQGDANRLSVVPPGANRTEVPRTMVQVGIGFFKIESVSPTSGVLSLKVWYRLSWRDERLAWDPQAFAGTSDVYVCPEAQLQVCPYRQIWTPDLVPYNGNTGISNSLEPALAIVRFDGTVFWSRQGTLSLLCGFSGLVNFPHEELKCVTDVGGWALDGTVQGIELLHGVGFEDLRTERSARTTYSEWEFLPPHVGLVNRNYSFVAPNSTWPVVEYVLRVLVQWAASLCVVSIARDGRDACTR